MKVKVEKETPDATSLAMEKLLAEARAEADDMRRRLEKLEKVLLSTRLIMGHELKKPTTAITGYLDLAFDDFDEAEQSTLSEHLQKARIECELLNELNLFFLALLKIDDRPEVMHGGKVTMRAFVDEVVSHLPQGLDADSRVKTRISPQVSQFNINPNAFKIILGNVIENGLRYSADDKTVTVQVKLQPDKRAVVERNLLRVEISDKGVGIPKVYLKNIFRPFVRLNSHATEGSGLGLTLVRSLVELNGGNVFIRSEEGEGTTVVLTIPEITDSEYRSD